MAPERLLDCNFLHVKFGQRFKISLKPKEPIEYSEAHWFRIYFASQRIEHDTRLALGTEI
jgi:hypothetical protein